MYYLKLIISFSSLSFMKSLLTTVEYILEDYTKIYLYILHISSITRKKGQILNKS